jgi:hypothetical protein
MAVGYSEALRNARLDEVTAAAGNAALLRIYSGTRPATGGAETTKLAELTCGTPFAGSALSGQLTANAISDDTNAAASGTASWARLLTSAAGFVLDMDAGEAADNAELTLDNKSIVAGGTVSVTSLVVTAGNP